MSIDAFDGKLLDLIQKDARASNAALGRAIGLSTSAVNARLSRLVDRGVIRRYTAEVDPASLGLGLLAFVEVLLESPADEAAFLEMAVNMPEVLECHHVTGDFSYLLKIRTSGTEGLEKVLGRLKSAPGLARTRTLVALSSPKETGGLPLGPGQ